MRTFKILILAALAAGCSSGGGEANNSQALAPGQREAQIGPLSLRYDGNKLVIERVMIPLPQDAKRLVGGMKLISKARQESLEKARCPGLPNNMCTPEGEGGVTVTMLNAPLAELSATIRNTRPATLMGREGVTWEGRYGERPATFTMVPIEQQTLLVIRQAEGEGAPDAATIDAVLASIAPTPPKPAGKNK